MPRACEVVIDSYLSIASHLSKTDIMMKSKSNKRKHASVLVAFNLGEITTVNTWDNGTFYHDEAGMAIVLEPTKSGQSVILVLGDDTDVLFYIYIE